MKTISDDETSLFFNKTLWNTLPMTVKLFTYFVTLPAWMIVISSIFYDWLPSIAIKIGIFIILLSSGAHIFFFARGYWRGEL